MTSTKSAAKPPTFHQSATALDPTVASLLSKNDLLVQSGVKYSEYVKLRPGDGIELTQNSRLLNFLHHDHVTFLNTKRLFLHLTFKAVKGDNEDALTQTDYVSINSPMNHSLLDKVVLNVGKSKKLIYTRSQNYGRQCWQTKKKEQCNEKKGNV